MLNDNLFFSYFNMILRVQGIVDTLTSWCEGCPCHRDELMNDRGSRKKPRLSHLSLQRPCPMKGKNLIELASHRLADILTELSQDIMLQLAMHSRFSLSPQEWEIVSKDYGHATAALRAGL